MKKILTYIFLLINISYSFGVEQIFKKANSLYHQQEFKNAITEYNKILEKGMESTELYFNIGNCYFQLALIEEISNKQKSKDLFKISKRFYNKSLVLSPSNEEIKNNIEKCNLKIGSKKTGSIIKRLWRELANSLEIKYWYLLSLASLFLFLILLLTHISHKSFIPLYYFIIIIILNITISCSLLSKEKINEEIMKKETHIIN